jgi:serine protease Do
MSDNQEIEEIERYVNGEMNREERTRFEKRRNEDAALNTAVTEHKQFTNLIKQYGERLDLEKRLDAIHNEIDVYSLSEELMEHPSWVVMLWRNHHSKISVAASIAIFAVLGTLFFTGYLSSRDQNYQQLRGSVDALKKSTKQLTKTVDGLTGHKYPANPGNYRGTGFAISSNGLIVTDYHVVRGADSVYVQSADGKSYRAKVIHIESPDIAILQITDPSFKALGAIPYSFKKAETDVGENVFTVGYPRDAMVLGPGYLTASTGFQNDTASYQVSIPANPGSSGGPLLDNRGNIIGIINGKETHIEGAAFAVKSNFLFKAVQDIPADSLKGIVNLNYKNVLAGLTRAQQIKKIQNYVFMIRVY